MIVFGRTHFTAIGHVDRADGVRLQKLELNYFTKMNCIQNRFIFYDLRSTLSNKNIVPAYRQTLK